jgi:hypothetical protein
VSGKLTLIKFSGKNERATPLEWFLLLLFFVVAWIFIIWGGLKLYHKLFD